MSESLSLPEDLMHLIEKRDAADRRKASRREQEACLPPEGDRRKTGDRRENKRRMSDG